MEKTWRWFGKNDKITLPMLRQIGVEGIVTALHEIPNGEVWPLEAILNQKTYIETYGLRWSVVVWGIERSGFFNGREKWAKGFENQRV